MGKGQASTQSGTTTQERQPTAEETRLNQLDVQLREATNPMMMEMQKSGLSLGNMLLTGNTPMPGWMAGIEKGISPEVTQGIVDQSLRDVDTRMAGQGLMDSGTRASVSARTSGDIRNAAAEYNQTNKLNLINMALSGLTGTGGVISNFSANAGQRLSTLGQQTKTYNNTMTGGGGGWSMGA
jgi:hypothetical protein